MSYCESCDDCFNSPTCPLCCRECCRDSLESPTSADENMLFKLIEKHCTTLGVSNAALQKSAKEMSLSIMRKNASYDSDKMKKYAACIIYFASEICHDYISEAFIAKKLGVDLRKSSGLKNDVLDNVNHEEKMVLLDTINRTDGMRILCRVRELYGIERIENLKKMCRDAGLDFLKTVEQVIKKSNKRLDDYVNDLIVYVSKSNANANSNAMNKKQRIK